VRRLSSSGFPHSIKLKDINLQCECGLSDDAFIAEERKFFGGEVMKRRFIFVLVIIVSVCSTNSQAIEVFSDDFEDGVIDTSLWSVGGGARGWSQYGPIGSGPWSYSNQEITDPTDGYLKCRVWGPGTANTYGAEAWVRTAYDFNKGQTYLINFTWEPDFLDFHYNYYYIQITDGYIAPVGDLHWPNRYPPVPPITEDDLAGTQDLLWHTDPVAGPIRGLNFGNTASIGKVTWSIEIDASGIARLYNGSDGTGALLHEATLNPAYPWYVRWMVSDGTSAGFPAGDAWFNLYDFHAIPEPATLVLLGLGSVMLRKKR